jgi:ABC-type glutathione transport system ATPase component
MQLADRVLVLDGGQLVADAPPAKLLGKPTPPSPEGRIADAAAKSNKEGASA